MEIRSKLDHFNINITDIERSLKFYKEALGLEVLKQKKAPDDSFILTYIGHPDGPVSLELTWLRDHPQPYELGDNESHIAFRVEGNYDAIREYHRKKGFICFENESMGLYFINDPDDYWIEILPPK